jgi:high-affinity Fe2+/Pb2+ permease
LRIWVSFLLLLALAGLFLHGVLIVRGVNNASSSVASADDAVRQAFNATLDAERAGANVSGLLQRLNQAGDALASAENALKDGDLEAAAGNTSLCTGIAENVSSDADALKASALAEAQSVFRTYLAFSVLSVNVFVVILALVWLWFKRRYARKVLALKPEVASDEA